ncbi:lysostaphin resistance A-like protein [Microbacterium sp. 16-032]|uniref:CPBP family intramembrane glutamic endopeptidase n=1 Tax=Microbacterium sp. 16-032 TaxID=3239808 RepID=UPI0034E24965
MRDQHNQTAVANGAGTTAEFDAGAHRAISDSSRIRRRRRTDWRMGGQEVSKWDLRVLLCALLGAGAGILASVVLAHSSAAGVAALSLPALWIGLLVPVAYAVLRGRPASLFRLRLLDVLWGVGLGVGLRLLQGSLSDANAASFPTATSLSLDLATSSLTAITLAAALIGPFVEEIFFRSVLIVVIFQMLRRSLGAFTAGATALLVSAGAFVCLHGAYAPLSLSSGLQLFLVGGVCSLLVLLTGRAWSAVILHVVYNAVYLVLVGVGTAGA